MYRKLSFRKIITTIDSLKNRIDDRFADSGLSQVCGELRDVACESNQRIKWISRPNLKIRIGISAVIISAVLIGIISIRAIEYKYKQPTMVELIQTTETLVNEFVLIGVSLFFLFSLETRIKRSRSLTALHELRSLAHVVDMHQLTKDPSVLDNTSKTKNSPERTLSSFELLRYLDYCSELFSLIGKIAAIYSERLPDPEIVSAANEIESLCASLSRKVWQKMLVVEKYSD